jgi:Uma2 family endonuclease
MAIIKSISELDLNGTYTYADYVKWQFDELVELIKGKIYPMAAPLSKHQIIVGGLYSSIHTYLRRKPCTVFVAPFDVRFPKEGTSDQKIYTVVQPDICVICDPDKIDRRGCLGSPDMVAEVISTSTAKKDLNEKFNLYEAHGVKEYWVVFPQEKTIQVYLLNAENKYELEDVYEEKGMAHLRTIDLEIDLDDIFEF